MMTFTPRIIGGIVILGFIVLLMVFGPSACTSFFTAKQEAKVAKGQAGASIQSGAEAMNKVSEVVESHDQTDATVKEGIDEIRSQPAGNSNAAAVRAACRMRSNFNSERCARLRGASPVDAAGGNSQR